MVADSRGEVRKGAAALPAQNPQKGTLARFCFQLNPTARFNLQQRETAAATAALPAGSRRVQEQQQRQQPPVHQIRAAHESTKGHLNAGTCAAACEGVQESTPLLVAAAQAARVQG